MMRFKVGGVYNAHTEVTEEDEMAGELGIPIKVTRISGGKIWIHAHLFDGDDLCPITLNNEGNEYTIFLEGDGSIWSYTDQDNSGSEDERGFDERAFDSTSARNDLGGVW